MPVLTDLASAEVRRQVKTLYGDVMSRPAVVMSDGLNETYACDVRVGPTDPTGKINQYINEKNGKKSALTGLPGQPPEDWQLDDSLPGHIDNTLHNVLISRNNQDLIYAEIGSPVVMTRTESGYWEITGFTLEKPGTHHLYPVDLGDMTIGTVIDLSIDTRLLTLAEIGEEQPFGILPFGASAIFEGGELVRIV